MLQLKGLHTEEIQRLTMAQMLVQEQLQQEKKEVNCTLF